MSDLTIRQMTREEVDTLVSWAADEGWNPGLGDAEIFWNTDPDAFIAAELGGKLVGGGTITSYGGDYGFMGFFIVRPDMRGQGLGNRIWHARRERLIARLHPDAAIGMDGVFAMQAYYAKGGFAYSHRNLRYSTEIPEGSEAPVDRQIVALGDIPFDMVAAYDRGCFPAARDAFLEQWIAQPTARALGLARNGKLAGYGVIRKCRVGCKIGPLFADDGEAAEALYAALAPFAAGGSLFLDAPENNPAAMTLVERHGMEEVFGCARMYLGEKPEVDEDCIFGVTTFELG